MKTGMFKKFFTAKSNSISTRMKICRGMTSIASTFAIGCALNKITSNNLLKSAISCICIVLDAIWLFR